MRFFISANPDEVSEGLRRRIRRKLEECPSFSYDETEPELVISVGGDGCMLRSIRRYASRLQSTAFVGLSSGKLGFLCDFQKEEADALTEAILSKTPRYDSCRMIEIRAGGSSACYLNEARVERMFHSLNAEVYINGEFFEEFHGNGLNFATALGSSAYNRSLGGPLLHPRIPGYIMGEIAPIVNGKYRSIASFMILRDGDAVTLRGDFSDCLIGGDTEYWNASEKTEEVTIRLSDTCAVFARYLDETAYARLKRSFL